MKLWCTTLLMLMVLLVGCETASRAVRLDTGQNDPLVFTPRSVAEPVELDDNENVTKGFW